MNIIFENGLILKITIYYNKWIFGFNGEIEEIIADHDGYCSGADNDEEIKIIYQYYKYPVNEDEYYTLIWINNECPKLFDHEYFSIAT